MVDPCRDPPIFGQWLATVDRLGDAEKTLRGADRGFTPGSEDLLDTEEGAPIHFYMPRAAK